MATATWFKSATCAVMLTVDDNDFVHQDVFHGDIYDFDREFHAEFRAYAILSGRYHRGVTRKEYQEARAIRQRFLDLEKRARQLQAEEGGGA